MWTDDYRQAYVSVPLANLREKPYGNVIDKLPKDTIVIVTGEESESWLSIKSADKKGVMHKSVLKLTNKVIKPEWYKQKTVHFSFLIIAGCIYIFALFDGIWHKKLKK